MDQAERLRQLVSGSPALATHHREWRSGNHHVIAVTSGKGGVGKTTIAVNLAVVLGEMSLRVLLVDADLGLANVDVMLGIEPGRHIGHLLLSGCHPDEVAATGPAGIEVISGGSGLRELAEAGPEERSALLQKLRTYYREFDVVVLDTSPGISADVVDFLRDADEVLAVTTPEPTALRDAYASIKTLIGHVPGTTLRLVINDSGSSHARQAVDALNQVTRKFLEIEFSDWFYIESDSLVSRCIRERTPIVRAYPRSAAAISFRRLAGTLAIASKATDIGCMEAVHVVG